MLLQQGPIEPVRFIIVTIRVVIPGLSAPNFVSHQKHCQTDRKNRCGQEVLHLPLAEFLYLWFVGRALSPAIPASVVVSSVAVFFTIAFVMLSAVENEVIQAEAIVEGSELDALFCLPLLVAINIGTSQE